MDQEEHICSQLPLDGVSIFRATNDELSDGWQWILEIQRTATEQHLEEYHVLEELGETVWSTEIGITHCPFCGMMLEPRPTSPRSAAWFRHLDHSGWNLKIK